MFWIVISPHHFFKICSSLYFKIQCHLVASNSSYFFLIIPLVHQVALYSVLIIYNKSSCKQPLISHFSFKYHTKVMLMTFADHFKKVLNVCFVLCKETILLYYILCYIPRGSLYYIHRTLIGKWWEQGRKQRWFLLAPFTLMNGEA